MDARRPISHDRRARCNGCPVGDVTRIRHGRSYGCGTSTIPNQRDTNRRTHRTGATLTRKGTPAPMNLRTVLQRWTATRCLSILTAITAVALGGPLIELACGGGNSPPTVGVGIECDISRCPTESTSFAYWGASGWVDAEGVCSDQDPYGPHVGSRVLAAVSAIYFAGGDFDAQRRIAVICPYWAPYIVTASAWSWD